MSDTYQFPPDVYMPRYKLYPSQPQMLHQLVVEMYTRAPAYDKPVADLFAMVPHGPLYKMGSALAEARKDILTSIEPSRSIVLVAGEVLPDDISAVVTPQKALHAWFGTIALDAEKYVGGVRVDGDMFAEYAAPLEAQFPFIRAYARRDNVCPYIVNIGMPTDRFEDFMDTLYARHGEETVYVFVQPDAYPEKFIEWVEKR